MDQVAWMETVVAKAADYEIPSLLLLLQIAKESGMPGVVGSGDPLGVCGTTNFADEESISYKGCFIRKLLILGSTSELSHRLLGG
ncbi:MAG TPA: hypothetical protein VGX94_14165 [Terriglobia bacterium]|nr:hypothetical protein [Terriglobia bacterium]